MSFKVHRVGYAELSSSQESLDEYNRLNPEEEFEFQTKLAEYPKHRGWGCRHTLALLGFFGFAISYSMRLNLVIAIVDMVQPSNSTLNVIRPIACPEDGGLLDLKNVSKRYEEEEFNTAEKFDWDGRDQGIILGAFYWSYALIQLPGGIIAKRVGGKWPFGLGLLITSILCLLTPMAARIGFNFLIFVRVMQGIGEGMTNSSMFMLMAKYFPPLERTKLGVFVFAGTTFGLIVTIPLCGLLISSGGGWSSAFLVFGWLGIIWFIFWTIFVFDTPEDHPRIEASELDYIRNSIGAQTSKVNVPTPWRKIFTSMPVWAVLISQIGQGQFSSIFTLELPSYLKAILHFAIRDNGFWTAIPQIGRWIIGLTSGWFSDYLREERLVSTTTVRKLFNTGGQWVPATLLIWLAYSVTNSCDKFLAVSLIIATLGINGVSNGGFVMNHIDLSPNHASVLHGLTNGIANLSGIGIPYAIGCIIKDGATVEDWRHIFLMSAALLFVGNLFYIIFASGEEQSWNRMPSAAALKDNKGDTFKMPLLGTGFSEFKKPSVLIIEEQPKDEIKMD